MIITYYGALCFKVQSGETVIAFNPPSKESEYKSPRFVSDIILISANDKDYNGAESISGKKEGGKPFVIDGKGEYEIGGICIKGISVNESLNTVFVLSIEGISVCHLGAISKEFDPRAKEEIGEVDILIAPIGGKNLLDPQKAAGAAAHLEPKIVIPANYDENRLKQFIKEFGAETPSPAEKLTVKKKDLMDKKSEIIVLKSAV